MTDDFSQVEAAVQAIACGELVIVLDDEDRENEGDFILAAEKATPARINFMLTHGKGLQCVPVLPELADRLNLTPMTSSQPDSFRTAYTITVDHRSVHTGVTAEERCRTILELVNPRSDESDFVRPGHVQPLVAKEGGVLRRAGHTEATVDLIRMAGLQPAGVLIEILNEEGMRATRAELAVLAKRFELEMITIEQLIRYRRQREQLVYRVAEARLPTRRGEFHLIAYGVKYESQEPIVLVLGNNTSEKTAPLVRLHSSCFTGDLINSLRCDCGDQLSMALDMISQEGAGVLVYLPQEGRGIGLAEKITAYALQDQGMETVQANLALGYKADPRDYGVGIQILKELGLTKVRLLTNNPKKTNAFIYGGFELEVVDQVPITPPMNEHNLHYLATKRDKMGHQLPVDE